MTRYKKLLNDLGDDWKIETKRGITKAKKEGTILLAKENWRRVVDYTADRTAWLIFVFLILHFIFGINFY